MERTKKMWFLCTPEEHNKIKTIAKEKGISVSDLAISSILGIEIVPIPEVTKTPFNQKVNKKGETKTYYKEYKRKKRGILKPVRAEY